jgi:hypothetical protein
MFRDAMPSLQDILRYYAGLSDEGVILAYRVGRSAYEPAAWDAINLEIERRDLTVIDAPIAARPQSSYVDLFADTPARMVAPVLDDDEVAPPNGAISEDARVRAQLVSELAAATSDLRRGAFTLAVGLGVAIYTLTSGSTRGGTYVIAFGAILMGIVRLIRGNSRRERALGIDPRTGRQRE